MIQGWFDAAAGPVVRPYAMTRGRTRATAGSGRIDLIAVVIPETADDPTHQETPASGGGDPSTTPDEDHLEPEHLEIVRRCRRTPLSVADLAGELDLPVGVVRVLIADLIDAELVRVARPVRPAELPDEHILREVINGLRAL